MISLIVAIAQNGVIGCQNRLIWHISEDLKHFKSITSGHPVIMGRKTFESLGRALPNRTNIVITRNAEYQADGCVVVTSLEDAISQFANSKECFIIGGAEIYAQTMPLADKLYLTLIHSDYQGDTYFPDWNRSLWNETSKEYHEKGEKFDKPFTFYEFTKKR